MGEAFQRAVRVQEKGKLVLYPFTLISIMSSSDNQFFISFLHSLKTGHCEYPTKCKVNPALGRWVTTQRAAKKNNDINEEHERRLNEIGFSWDRHNTNDRKMKYMHQM